MNRPNAFLDTCVLYSSYLRDAMLSIADATVYRPMWSHDVLEELTRNLADAGIADSALRRLVDQMRQAFQDAEVTGYQHRIDAMTCHPKDRHVLAAAVHGRADTIVTFNLRDFPRESVDAHGLRVQAPDDFLLDLIDLEPGLSSARSINKQRGTSANRRPCQGCWLRSSAPVYPRSPHRHVVWLVTG